MSVEKVTRRFNDYNDPQDVVPILSREYNLLVDAINDVHETDVSLKANIASPTFTGVVTTPAIAIVGAAHIPIDLSGTTPVFNQEHAFIGIGGWTTPVAITSQTDHFVPIQVNLTSGTSVAKDIAAARFRVDTAAANTLTAVNVLEMRSALKHAVGSHANLQVSSDVQEAVTCTGDLLVGYFSLQGDSAITCSNHVNVLEATNVCTGSGVKNVAHFTQNAAATAVDIVKAEAIAGTLTNGVEIANTGGTITNALKLTGTFTRDILLSTGGIITNAVDGTITLTDNIINLDGDITQTGHKNAQLMIFTTFNCPAPGTDWTPTGYGVELAQSKTAAKVWIPLSGLKVGDEIVSYRVVGDATEAAALTFNCKLTTISKGDPLTIVDVAGGGITQVTADGVFDVEADLTADETVAVDTGYMLECVATTGVGDSIRLGHVMVTINRK